jgi:hypothetical protein
MTRYRRLGCLLMGLSAAIFAILVGWVVSAVL